MQLDSSHAVAQPLHVHRGKTTQSRQPTHARKLPAQMLNSSAIATAVHDLQQRLNQSGGVALRVFECSLNCTAKHTEMPKMVDGFPRVRVDDCIGVELVRRNRPASLLRWDVPAVIFNAGRCTSPARDEVDQFPPAAVMTKDGYYPHGFVGHNVTGAGIGWVFRNLAKRKRGGAFGHDAWTFNYRLSGTKHHAKMADRDALEPCRNGKQVSHNSNAYAESRWAARKQTRGYALGSAQQIAASFKWDFVNTSMNCYWDRNDWERALDDQRAFAMLLAKHEEKLVEECSIWGSLYNQIHVSWNASDLAAIFYVNDTLTARRGRRSSLLLRLANAASTRAYHDAVLAQMTVARLTGRVLPVVQYRVAQEECFDGQPLATRIQQAEQRMAVSMPQIFHPPGT